MDTHTYAMMIMARDVHEFQMIGVFHWPWGGGGAGYSTLYRIDIYYHQLLTQKNRNSNTTDCLFLVVSVTGDLYHSK